MDAKVKIFGKEYPATRVTIIDFSVYKAVCDSIAEATPHSKSEVDEIFQAPDGTLFTHSDGAWNMALDRADGTFQAIYDISNNREVEIDHTTKEVTVTFFNA